jgi:hypothetical protein
VHHHDVEAFLVLDRPQPRGREHVDLDHRLGGLVRRRAEQREHQVVDLVEDLAAGLPARQQRGGLLGEDLLLVGLGREPPPVTGRLQVPGHRGGVVERVDDRGRVVAGAGRAEQHVTAGRADDVGALQRVHERHGGGAGGVTGLRAALVVDLDGVGVVADQVRVGDLLELGPVELDGQLPQQVVVVQRQVADVQRRRRRVRVVPQDPDGAGQQPQRPAGALEGRDGRQPLVEHPHQLRVQRVGRLDRGGVALRVGGRTGEVLALPGELVVGRPVLRRGLRSGVEVDAGEQAPLDDLGDVGVLGGLDHAVLAADDRVDLALDGRGLLRERVLCGGERDDDHQVRGRHRVLEQGLEERGDLAGHPPHVLVTRLRAGPQVGGDLVDHHHRRGGADDVGQRLAARGRAGLVRAVHRLPRVVTELRCERAPQRQRTGSSRRGGAVDRVERVTDQRDRPAPVGTSAGSMNSPTLLGVAPAARWWTAISEWVLPPPNDVSARTTPDSPSEVPDRRPNTRRSSSLSPAVG